MTFSANLKRIVLLWIAAFAIWSLWESAIRILVDYSDWPRWKAISYIFRNLAASFLFSIPLAAFHSVVYSIAYKINSSFVRTLLTSTWALPFSTLCWIPVIVLYHPFIQKSIAAIPIRWILAAVLFVVIYAVILLMAQIFRIPAILKTRSYLYLSVLVVLPFVSILFCDSASGPNISAASKSELGPIKRIVLISIDTLRYDYVGAYGSSIARTPAMDRVAAEGVRFENAIAPMPVTGPSHISMFTGLPPLVHGIVFNGIRLSRSTTTFTSILRAAGFHTAAFVGGYPLKASNSGLDEGFMKYDDRFALADFFGTTFNGRFFMLFPSVDRASYRTAEEVTKPAIKWLQQNGQRPFFMFLHFYDPHFPYGVKNEARRSRSPFGVKAKKEDLQRQKELYAREVENVDGQIARVIDVLKRLGIYDNTLLIITADHGEGLGEHEYYYDHVGHIYENLIRVPLIFRYPPLLLPKTVIEQQVALLDLHKTILAAARLNPVPRAGGYNLLEVAAKVPSSYKRALLSHSIGEHSCDSHGVRTQNWKMIRCGTEKQANYELYHLPNDPGENNNLFSASPRVAAEMKSLLEQHLSLMKQSGNKLRSVDELTPEQIEQLKSLGYFNN